MIGKLFYASYAAAGSRSSATRRWSRRTATRSIAETLTASLLIVLDLAAFLVWNSNVNYVSDVMCRTRRSRPLPEADPNYQPMVSIHIPAYNEPPELLIATIKAVEEIDYPDFEIVVIDNNTKDPAIYGPVEEYCRGRERIKFVHVAPWPGYKAGACNLALRRYTDPRAEIIGMIDADDIVKPHYLRETVGYFVRPADRIHPDLRRQPRLRRKQLLPGLRGLVPGLLPGGHVVAERARHRAVRRHDGPLPPQCARGGRRLERVVHQRGHRGLAASAQSGLVGAVHPAMLRPRRRAAELRRAEHAAPPVVLRRDADPAAPLAEPHALGPLARQPPHARPAPRLPHGVARGSATCSCWRSRSCSSSSPDCC